MQRKRCCNGRWPQLSGEPYALKGARTVRRGEAEKWFDYALPLTLLPMEKGLADLLVIMDWTSRKILSWRLSNTMDADFCVDALQAAIMDYGRPESFNTDQGAQFTSEAFMDVLKDHDVQISIRTQ